MADRPFGPPTALRRRPAFESRNGAAHLTEKCAEEIGGGMQILIVEDQPNSQAWLQTLVERVYENAVCELAASIKEARDKLAQRHWQLVLVDVGLPDGSGVSLVNEMSRQWPEVPAIVTTIFDDDETLFQALAAGARGYLLKGQPEASLVQQLQQWRGGQPPISAPIARRVLAYFHKHPPRPVDETSAQIVLTPREHDVLKAIGRGLRTREVAEHLGLTDQTVATYVRNLYSKLNIRSRSQATLEAVRRGLI